MRFGQSRRRFRCFIGRENLVEAATGAASAMMSRSFPALIRSVPSFIYRASVNGGKMGEKIVDEGAVRW